MNPDFSQIGPFLLAALVVFGIYRRFRRTFGQQLLRPVAMYVRIGLLVIVGCLLLSASGGSREFIGGALAGAAVGVAMALWGAARTRFVWVENRLYYVPHTYTGIVVSLLFIGRLLYRLIQVYGAMHAARVAGATDQALTSASMFRSPLTVGLFFVLMGYYVCYYSVVLHKSKLVPPAGADAAGADAAGT